MHFVQVTDEDLNEDCSESNDDISNNDKDCRISHNLATCVRNQDKEATPEWIAAINKERNWREKAW